MTVPRLLYGIVFPTTFSCFDRTPACDGETRTQGHNIYHASIALHGKNVCCLWLGSTVICIDDVSTHRLQSVPVNMLPPVTSCQLHTTLGDQAHRRAEIQNDEV